jgi:hypothetical protein
VSEFDDAEHVPLFEHTPNRTLICRDMEADKALQARLADLERENERLRKMLSDEGMPENAIGRAWIYDAGPSIPEPYDWGDVDPETVGEAIEWPQAGGNDA